MYQKAWCTCRVVAFLIKPISFLTFPLPSPSSFRKVPNIPESTRVLGSDKCRQEWELVSKQTWTLTSGACWKAPLTSTAKYTSRGQKARRLARTLMTKTLMNLNFHRNLFKTGTESYLHKKMLNYISLTHKWNCLEVIQQLVNRELKQQRFWATHVNRK